MGIRKADAVAEGRSLVEEYTAAFVYKRVKHSRISQEL